MNESDILKSEINIEDIPRVIDMCLAAKIIPVFMGESGIGKTESIAEYAIQRNLHPIFLNCGHLFAEDFGGVRDKGDWIVFKMNAVFDVPGPSLLFIDELTRARGDLRNLILGLVNERTLYGQRISDHIKIVLAANPSTDEYSDTEDAFGDLAAVRRFTVFTVKTTPESWVDWAKDHGVSEKTRQFILQNNLTLTNGQACPRQWVKIDAVLQKDGIEAVKLLAPGTIGMNYRHYLEFLSKARIITGEMVLSQYDDIQDEVKANRELQVALASDLVNAKFKPVHRANMVAFLCDLPQELIYSSAMKLLKNKSNKLIFDWIDANKFLKDVMENQSNY